MEGQENSNQHRKERNMKVTRIAPKQEQRKTRVAAYCRVSTSLDNQVDSLEAQKNYYEQYIKANPEWEFAGIYYDEQSGTSAEKREGLQKMVDRRKVFV